MPEDVVVENEAVEVVLPVASCDMGDEVGVAKCTLSRAMSRPEDEEGGAGCGGWEVPAACRLQGLPTPWGDRKVGVLNSSGARVAAMAGRRPKKGVETGGEGVWLGRRS